MRRIAKTAALLVTLTASTGAWPGAAQRPAPVQAAIPLQGQGQGRASSLGLGTAVLAMGRSVGSPTAGHLIGGSRLPEGPHLRVVPVYAHGEVRWGLGSLVGMIDRAAQKVRRQYPDAVLNVGHLSRHGGGEVDRHVSHESGRDADLGFYVRNAQGKSIFAEHFVAFRGDGTAPSWPGAFFDDARNWALVRALLTDSQARVSHLFVATPLRARLLAYAAKSGAPADLRDRAALAMVQPHGSLPHDDHFHVRISCPGWQRECVEVPIRKKPALVAKVPMPKSRVRAHSSPLGDKGEAKIEAKDGKAAAVAQRASRTAPVTSAGLETSRENDGKGPARISRAPIEERSTTLPTPIPPPPGSLLVPQNAPTNDDDGIDDVDGLM